MKYLKMPPLIRAKEPRIRREPKFNNIVMMRGKVSRKIGIKKKEAHTLNVPRKNINVNILRYLVKFAVSSIISEIPPKRPPDSLSFSRF